MDTSVLYMVLGVRKLIDMFKLELKNIFKSSIFYIISLLIVLFCMSQLGDAGYIKEPTKDQETYGKYISSDINKIKPKAFENLVDEYIANEYVTYPYGFYKVVHLYNNQEREIAKVISTLTGESLENIEDLKDSSKNSDKKVDKEYLRIKKDLTNEQFIDVMDLTDKIIGKSSLYNKDNIIMKFGKTEKSYKDALADYKLIVEKDKFTGAYARYFADYVGFTLAILPIFLAVNLWFLDKKTKSQDILYTREVSSKNVVLSRYMAMVVSMSLLVFTLTTFYNIDIISHFGIENVDIFAYYKYIILWLIPTMMIPLALGTLLTIVTDTPIGIVVQIIWFFLDVNARSNSINGGGYGLSLVLRHNTVGNVLGYMNNINVVLLNRLLYVVISIIMILIAQRVYNKKRVGKLGGVNVLRKIR